MELSQQSAEYVSHIRDVIEEKEFYTPDYLKNNFDDFQMITGKDCQICYKSKKENLKGRNKTTDS